VNFEVILNPQDNCFVVETVIFWIVFLKMVCHNFLWQIKLHESFDMLNASFLEDQVVASNDGADILLEFKSIALLNKGQVHFLVITLPFELA
jgi:hypothetical protein